MQPQPINKITLNHKVRLITATSLFDGHDAAINVMRRILQDSGAEVIHLGHNRSVEEIVNAAIQEDVQGIAVSSYQGGHIEFFKYMIDLLKSQDSAHIRVFGGGGGVIVPQEIEELHRYGVARIYSVSDGQKLGLQGMINDLLATCDFDPKKARIANGGAPLADFTAAQIGQPDFMRQLSRWLTDIDNQSIDKEARESIQALAKNHPAPVLGITGTGGAGKSSLTDELIRRFCIDQKEQLYLAVLSVDPSRKRTGGALLGDRIRMNAINHPNIFMRSFATRDTGTEISAGLPLAICACRAAGFDLIIIETSGIGQGDTAIVPLCDTSLYVMTPEFGANSQLEKIDMLDHAEFIAINKFDRRGAEDALKAVSKQVQRNRQAFDQPLESLPVFGTIASRFNDEGVSALYQALLPRLVAQGLKDASSNIFADIQSKHSRTFTAIVPPKRVRYLAEIAESVRHYHDQTRAQCAIARDRQALRRAQQLMGKRAPVAVLETLIEEQEAALSPENSQLLSAWKDTQSAYSGQELISLVRGREIRTPMFHTSLSGSLIRKVAIPPYEDEGEILRFLRKENLPGFFPYTAGVFAFKRDNEDPTRMFAGEGDPARTNRRFKKLSAGMSAVRLSTAFDSVTLYGCDPDPRPDIYGKIGNSGVSIATLEDMKTLYEGFKLCHPMTSVSMTINGPAPIILAMFFNVAIDQQLEDFHQQQGRAPLDDEAQSIRAQTLANVRGTVQADILKEDQGQNTCIFSTEFALKMMGDMQEYFVQHHINNFYSVSISGYHIAEAGANPISQLAFTLANGFTYVETYLARGMKIDDFAPNLSFFFSNGMDPEYTVIGRVARRIWAVAMRDRYGANERSQKLKYHIQTSGRSLHAQEIDFNDIRTTLQALIAIYDHCNSLHTNAYDEAITTPTEESVRRALAIQLIINREWGLAKNENPNQGSFIIEELTDLVEEAVLKEFEAISERGGVLGAMETGYQRSKIQEESLYYEGRKHDGSYPIIGVNTFLSPSGSGVPESIDLARSTEEEKQSQLSRLLAFQTRHASSAQEWIEKLQQAVIARDNVFAVLMSAVRYCSLGQISQALYQVGGQYRRNM